MTEIWFIRHGETDWNRQRRLQGWQDIPLNEFGVNQASLLAARLREEARHTPIHAIYSSDLQRAHATAVPVSEQLGLRVRVEPGIRERGFGVLEGLDHDRIDVQAPEAAAAWKSRDPLRPLDGGEQTGAHPGVDGIHRRAIDEDQRDPLVEFEVDVHRGRRE